MAGPGADYSTFAELITEAHKRGFRGLTTELIDYHFEDGNPVYAIVKAVADFESGSFEGIGDATRENTNRGIGPHLVRMASTRAMARALRVALGVGKTAVEELGGEAPDDRQAPERGSSPGKQSKPATKPSASSAGNEAQAITPANLKLLKALADDVYGDRDGHLDGHEWMQRELGQPLDELTNEKAERMIEKLNAKQTEAS